MRFRDQLLILVLSVLIPAFVASIVAVLYVYREEQAAQEKGMTEAARAFSLLVGNALKTREATLRTLAASPALARGDLREFYAYAREMAPTPETTIILVDKNDRQLLNTRAPFGSELPLQRASNIKALMAQYGANRTLVSDVFLTPVGKGHDFILQVPVLQDGEIRYFLVMGVNASALQSLLLDQNLPAQWLGTIVDRRGVVVSRSRNPERYIGEPSSERLKTLFSLAPEGVMRSVTLDGVPVKTFFNRVAFSDWTVVLSIPESELRAVPIRAAALLGLMMAMLLVLAFLVARRVSTRVVARIDQLGASADRMAQGEAVTYQPQGLVEVDAVGARIVDASKQIRRSREELERRVATAVAEAERAQQALVRGQKLEALGRLTGGIAHEFNNLLQTLTTALQLARMVSNQERVQSLIDTCNKAVKRAASLTGQLSAFGRVQDARLETVDLGKLVRNVEQLVENLLPSNVSLEVNMAEDHWPVTIDPVQFELAMINLAINAKDAMPSGGIIRVVTSNDIVTSAPDGIAPGEYVRVSVSDSGSGMSQEVLAKALEPFFTTKKVGHGSGLGLPQAYGFARQSGGTLCIQSSLGKGTTVEILLPKAHALVNDRDSDAQEQTAQGTAAGTLLLVEDDPLVREAVVPALKDAGMVVLSAESADAALALLDAGTAVDAVFSDIVMPGKLNGMDLAKVIRERHPEVTVVLATGYSEQRASIAGVRILPKPYTTSDVIKVLREIPSNPKQ